MRYQKRRKPTAKAVSIDTNTLIFAGAGLALVLAMVFEALKLTH